MHDAWENFMSWGHYFVTIDSQIYMISFDSA